MKVREINYTDERLSNELKKRNRKIKRRLKVLKFLLLVCLVVTTAVLLALSPLFKIKTIEVTGSKKFQKEELITVSGLTTGVNGFKAIAGGEGGFVHLKSKLANILFLRYGKAEQDILKKFPYIKEAKVQFALPGKIKISLSERVPLGMVPHGSMNLVMDEEGVIVDAVQPDSKQGIPTIKGFKFKKYELGQPLKLDIPEILRNVNRLVKELKATKLDEKTSLMDRTSYIDVNDPANLCVNFESRLTVKLGDLEELRYRLDFFKQIYIKNLRKDEKGTIDFTTGENPSFRPEK